jgi:hypothetical protein
VEMVTNGTCKVETVTNSKQTLVNVSVPACTIIRVGHNCIFTPYMTVYLMISLPKIPYIHHIYMVLANPNYNGNRFWHYLVRTLARGGCARGCGQYRSQRLFQHWRTQLCCLGRVHGDERACCACLHLRVCVCAFVCVHLCVCEAL